MSEAISATPQTPISPWAPFASAGFRRIWLAAVAGYLASWIQDVSQSWVMTSLTQDPLIVSLVQVAETLPLFLLAFPAGAVADLIDRRTHLLVALTWMVAVAVCFGVSTLGGWMTPWLLLALTFSVGMGSAMTIPVWPATYPEVVPRAQLPAAIALGAVSLSLSRIVGPALGGMLVGWSGPGVAFFAMAGCSGLAWLLILSWRRTPEPRTGPRESFMEALRSGIRFAAAEPAFQAVILRALAFVLFANAGIALLPLIVREQLQGTSTTYGILWACTGTGGLLTSLVLERLRARFSRDQLVAGATLVFAGVLVALGTLRDVVWLAPFMVLNGAVGMIIMSSMQVSAQLILPGWVQARGLALFLVTVMGGMAGGSVLWGALARAAGISTALYVAAGGAVLALIGTWRFSLGGGTGPDLTPSLHWPRPVMVSSGPAVPGAANRGPVLITVSYEVQPARRAEFVRALHRLSHERRRDGARQWSLFQESAQPTRYLETFLVKSWQEHLLQHERVTVTDQALQAEIQTLLVEGTAPVVTHYVTAVSSIATPRD
jgi:predicted MFS family arabinose efflux permease